MAKQVSRLNQPSPDPGFDRPKGHAGPGHYLRMSQTLVEVERKQGFRFGGKLGEDVSDVHVMTAAGSRGGYSGERKKLGIGEGFQEGLAFLFAGEVYGPSAGENTDESLLTGQCRIVAFC